MSVNTLETVLYQVASTRDGRRRFLADRAAFLDGFGLEVEERKLILEFDVKSLCDLGVNPMLVLGYWLEAEGSKSIHGYMRRMMSSESRHG